MIENLDIKGLLIEYDISFKERGKNVSRGWVNLEVCPFCGDSAFHCGINLTNLGFHCWVCDEKGSVFKLLREMEIFKGRNIRAITASHEREWISTPPEGLNPVAAMFSPKNEGILTLPKGLIRDLPPPHRNYLLSRGFDPDFLSKKYKLRAVYNTGTQKYRFRIIVPVFIDGKMVSFVAAATLRSEGVVKYLNCSPEESIIPVNHCLYNYDSISDIVVIVEGVTDVWRMGDGFVASFRKGITSEQIVLLTQKKLKKVFIMYDADATKNAISLADKLQGIIPSVEVLELDKGDPADLTMEEAQEIRSIVFR